MSWVIANSKEKGSRFVVLLMIANHAHSDGRGSWAGYETLARESRISVRQAIRCVQKLEQAGSLTVAHGAGPFKTNLYAVKGMDEISTNPQKANRGDNLSYDKPPRESVQGGDIRGPQMSPKPSLTENLREPNYRANTARHAHNQEAKARRLRKAEYDDAVRRELMVGAGPECRR